MIHCCDANGIETVLESDGRAGAPVTIAATWDAGTASFVQIGPGGLQLLRRVDPSDLGTATTTATAVPAVPGLVAVSNTGRAWVNPAAPTVLQVIPSTTTAATRRRPARPRPARLVLDQRDRGGGALGGARGAACGSISRRWPRRGSGAGRPCRGSPSAEARSRSARRAGCWPRAAGSPRVLATTRRAIEAVGVDGRRVAWIERGVRRKGGRVGVVHLGVAR